MGIDADVRSKFGLHIDLNIDTCHNNYHEIGIGSRVNDLLLESNFPIKSLTP